MEIKQEFIDQIVAQAKQGYPKEVCGIIAGKDGTVTKVYEMTNVSETPETFYNMEAQEQFNVLKDARKLGLEMLGIYHSHPVSKAYPSEEDCKMCFYPEAFYMIVSLQNIDKPEIGVFKIKENIISEKGVKINE